VILQSDVYKAIQRAKEYAGQGRLSTLSARGTVCLEKFVVQILFVSRFETHKTVSQSRHI
jgi:hypothetical protein